MTLSLDKKHLHHANLLEGDRAILLSELLEYLYAEKLTAPRSPDLHVLEYDAFGIDDSHKIRTEQSMHAVGGGKKFFIVVFNTMTSEAQNALLKTLEEPTEHTHFFLITRTKETLLPTVRSRLSLVATQKNKAKTEHKEGEEFLSDPIPLRLLRIEKFTKVKADDKSAAKDLARDFLSHLEIALAAHLSIDQSLSTHLHEVITARRYLGDRSPSLKILLEHLALTIPVINQK